MADLSAQAEDTITKVIGFIVVLALLGGTVALVFTNLNTLVDDSDPAGLVYQTTSPTPVTRIKCQGDAPEPSLNSTRSPAVILRTSDAISMVTPPAPSACATTFAFAA